MTTPKLESVVTKVMAPKKYRVMTVCTGNICRSPMAEVVLRTQLQAAGLTDLVVVDSTGISSEERGNPIDNRAIKILQHAGYGEDAALDEHQARRVRDYQLEERDLVLAMTAHHARSLRRIAELSGLNTRNIKMFRSFDPDAPVIRDASEEHLLDVEDPWYGDTEDFFVCLKIIERTVTGVLDHIKRELGQ